ncbi:toprim domain-containing protein, partial [Argonema antarcticum]|uniref:toprim domain-containing protein n=1 Tax=Argonema antarcticum TaxID=2942763 RepID=UPI0020124034
MTLTNSGTLPTQFVLFGKKRYQHLLSSHRFNKFHFLSAIVISNKDCFDDAQQPSGASQSPATRSIPRTPNGTNALRDHWEKEMLPKLSPEMVYTDPSHRFQISPDRWRGGSPFRESKSGTSFAVWPDTLRFYDSGMGFAGDPISYIHSLKVGRWEHPKGADWVEALRELSRRAGVEHLFPERNYSKQHIERAQKWEERRGIFATIYTLCAQYLWTDEAASVRTHLIEERGFTEKQLQNLQIGLYPSLEAVQGTLREHLFNIDLASECGVLTRKWEGYVIFPWLTPQGEPLTMYGHWPADKHNIPLKKNHPGWKKEHEAARRTWNKLSEAQKIEQPWSDPHIPKKYACWNPKDKDGSWLSSKESPLYFERAVKALHSEVVLVEGVTDTAMAQSLGDTRVIACVAASLSKEQVQTLSRHRIQRVNICLDPDSAGDKGIISCIKSLLAAGITPYVAPRLPDGDDGDGDPDKFIIKNGIEAWKQHTSFDRATHGCRWTARHIIASHCPVQSNGDRQLGDSPDKLDISYGHQNEQLSDAVREIILREASLWASSVDKQWSEALATYFWPEIKQAVGTIEIPETLTSPQPGLSRATEGSKTIRDREDSSTLGTISLLLGNDGSSKGGSNRNNNSNGHTPNNFNRNDNNSQKGGGGGNDGGDYSDSDDWDENDWRAPVSWNGEIGKWFKNEDGTFKFKPLTDFDFIIIGEVMAAPGSDAGGGYVVKIKRAFESTEREILLKSLECLTVKEFRTTINKKFGVHLSCRLSQDQLVALIHERLKDYHVNRAGKTYRCIDRWGQQEDGTWVFADCQFLSDGTPTDREGSRWVYNPSLGAVDNILPPEILPHNRHALRNLLEAQQKFAGSNFIYFLLCNGYVAASLNFQEIIKVEKFFPILNPCGDGGSKKTVAVRSALSLAGWGDMERGGLSSTTVSMAYERLKCLGSIPSLWDDPFGNKKQDSETLDEFMHRLYNAFPRQVRGNSQQPHSSLIVTSNKSLGESNPATKSRIIHLFMPVIKDGNREAWSELRKSCLQAAGAFQDLIKIGYPQKEIYALRSRLNRHLPTAHERAADNLAPLVYYTKKIAELGGLDIDVEGWVIKHLCPTMNENLSGLNSVADFFEKLPALISANDVGTWNADTIESREYGKVLALHLPSIWTQFERQFSPAYNRPVLERVLVEMGATKNKSAKLHSDRDGVLAYQRALLTIRFDENGNALYPNQPERVNKKCLFVPEKLWQSLNLDWLVEDDDPDDDFPGGSDGGGGGGSGGGGDFPGDDATKFCQEDTIEHSATFSPSLQESNFSLKEHRTHDVGYFSSSNQASTSVTESSNPESVNCHNLESKSISASFATASNSVTDDRLTEQVCQ